MCIRDSVTSALFALSVTIWSAPGSSAHHRTTVLGTFASDLSLSLPPPVDEKWDDEKISSHKFLRTSKILRHENLKFFMNNSNPKFIELYSWRFLSRWKHQEVFEWFQINEVCSRSFQKRRYQKLKSKFCLKLLWFIFAHWFLLWVDVDLKVEIQSLELKTQHCLILTHVEIAFLKKRQLTNFRLKMDVQFWSNPNRTFFLIQDGRQ